MAADTRRQAVLLAVLLAVLAGALWWNLAGRSPAQPAGTPVQAQAGAAARAGAAPVEDVRLEALDVAPPTPAVSARDPFRFSTGRGATNPSGPAPEPLAGESLPAPPAQVGTPGAPASAAIPLRFIGIVTEAAPGRRLAVLTDGRSPPFYGREGDIIEGRYRIVRIGVESIELAHVDGRGQQTIRLSGS